MDVLEQPKLEKDFIMLSEFSELVGPVPVVSKVSLPSFILT